MVKPVRLAFYILTGLVVIMAMTLFDRYQAMRLSVPEIAGSVTVDGLSAPVEILRDKYGVPHISGANDQDVFYALGYAHAQDRLWQMEFTRRLAGGRLSEILGSSALSFDRFFRTLNFSAHVQASYPKLPAETQNVLESYSAGVNAIINNSALPLPPEFAVLFHRPEPWQPEDSLLVLKVMAFSLSGNMFQEIDRTRLTRRLTPEQLAEFFPPYPGDDPVVLPDVTGLFERLPLERIRAGLPKHHIKGASNNWVVGGRYTETGKPLLANDPHLDLTTPSIWYLAHLVLSTGNIIGGSLAGFPGIILGRNDRIAWGFTNTGPDTQDLFIEKVSDTDPNLYLTPDGYAPFQTRQETIKVRFGKDVTLELRETRHGPVLPAGWGGAEDFLEEGEVLALQWTALKDDDTTAAAAIGVLAAHSWTEIRDVLKAYKVPMQNIVYGDIDGNIGFIAPGLVPIRKPENPIRGLMPSPGWDGLYDWEGYIPFDDLPQIYNPASGRVVTANNKVVSDDYPYFVTSEWEPGLRARRIETLLSARNKHDVASFQDMQRDEVSQLALDLLLRMLKPIAETDSNRQALQLLRDWNGDMAADTAEPLIFAAWYRRLSAAVFADELGPLFADHWTFRPVFMSRVIGAQAGTSNWCDNIDTDEQETCTDIIRLSLDRALQDLNADYGGNVSDWRWGAAHMAVHRHNAFRGLPVLKDLFGIEVPTGGGFYTINRGGHWFAGRRPYANIHGSGYRAIYDLADLDRSVFMQSTGQSGNPFSPFFDTFAQVWADVGYMSMSTARGDYVPEAAGILTLTP